jgi:hypothetical protein
MPDNQFLFTALEFISRSFSMTVGSTVLAPTYWQAGTIIFLVFIIVLSIARWRHLYIKWNLQSFIPTVLLGFILTLALEGVLLLGGKTILTELLGWENAPKPISTALDEGRNKLVDVLGITDPIPISTAKENPTAESIIQDFEMMNATETEKAKTIICSP